MSTQADAYCLPRWVWRVADGVAIGGIAYVIVYYLTAFRFDDLFVVINRQVDFKQWYSFPPIIAEHLQYPSVVWNDWKVPFPYLPSAVVMFLPLSALPQMAAFALWIVLQAVALVVVLWIGLELTGASKLRGRLLIALGAVLLADNQVGWDFRTHNNNVIYLALVMSAVMTRAPWLSGLLFGISCNLKIYSGALLLVFVWRREYRLAVAILFAAVLIAIVLPIAVFGVSGFWQLLQGWAGQALFYHPPPGQPAVVPANLWQEASALLVGNDPASIAVSVMVWSSQAIWLIGCGRLFHRGGRIEPFRARTSGPACRRLCRSAGAVAVQRLVYALPRHRAAAGLHAVVDGRGQPGMGSADPGHRSGRTGWLPDSAIFNSLRVARGDLSRLLCAGRGRAWRRPSEISPGSGPGSGLRLGMLVVAGRALCPGGQGEAAKRW